MGRTLIMPHVMIFFILFSFFIVCMSIAKIFYWIIKATIFFILILLKFLKLFVLGMNEIFFYFRIRHHRKITGYLKKGLTQRHKGTKKDGKRNGC